MLGSKAEQKEHLMGKNIHKGFIRFSIIFILLMFIVIIMPSLVERMVMLLSDGIRPDRNSIIVFMHIKVEYGSMHEIIDNIKKIINFM